MLYLPKGMMWDEHDFRLLAAHTVFEPCNRYRTLMVDDERAVVRMFRTILNTALPRLQVDVAFDGLAAIGSFVATHPAVVVMDLRLPGGVDGLAVFERIREECVKRNWIMPSVIFCTGFIPPAAMDAVIGRPSKALSSPEAGDTGCLCAGRQGSSCDDLRVQTVSPRLPIFRRRRFPDDCSLSTGLN